jgi:hypothetical protein
MYCEIQYYVSMAIKRTPLRMRDPRGIADMIHYTQWPLDIRGSSRDAKPRAQSPELRARAYEVGDGRNKELNISSCVLHHNHSLVKQAIGLQKCTVTLPTRSTASFITCRASSQRCYPTQALPSSMRAAVVPSAVAAALATEP